MKKKVNCWYFLNLLFWVTMPSLLIAQNTPATGLLPEDEAYKALQLVDKKDGAKYPVPDTSSLKMYCPSPGNQGKLESCVGWATSHHALTIMKAIQNGITDKDRIKRDALSASYVFNNIKLDNDCSKGAYLTKALTFLQQYGAPPSLLFKNSRFDCDARPDDRAAKAALQNRITRFDPIFDLNAEDDNKIEETKFWIARKKPVIVGLHLTKDFLDIGATQKKWTPNLKDTINNYHAMVVVGYNNRNGGEFELMNSYGPNWGNGGFIKISYKDYEALVKYAFVIDAAVEDFANQRVPDSRQKERFPIGTSNTTTNTTTLKISRVQYRADGYDFVEQNFYFDQAENYYTPSGGPWTVESQYRLLAKDLFAGRHLYIFSFDAQKKVISIWPSKQSRELEVLQYTEVYIPEEVGALEIKQVGKDYVVLLYSRKELLDFEERLQQFRELTSSFKERMQAVFGDVLIAENLVNYAPNELRFNCTSSKADTTVIPLVLAFDVSE